MQSIHTLIPLHQPAGVLDVPRDDWDALNDLVRDRFGGHIHVRAEKQDGFIVVGGDGPGLPTFRLTVEVPDEVSIDDVVNGEFDEKLRETLTRNVRAVRELQPA